MASVDVCELRQNLSRYLDRVKEGESLEVTEHGRVMARLSPAGEGVSPVYDALASSLGATVPTGSLTELAAHRARRGTPAGTTDAVLAEGRDER